MPKIEIHKTENSFVADKFAGKIKIEDALSYYTFVKGGRIQRIMHKLKYNNLPDLGVHLGNKFGVLLNQHGYQEKYDLIIPIPLHKIRLRMRGYNQSEKIAQGFSEAMALPMNDKVVKRIVKTNTQTNKSRLGRWKNVTKIFEIMDRKLVENKRILLVDDVVTTGATLESCAQELLDAGAQYVGIAVVAAAK
ncbi:MAG: phosphoribosyltransferase family protein [Bacteroidota bacterium]